MDATFQLLALLPIVVLLVLSLWQGVKVGIYAGLAVTCLLFFVWESPWLAFPAAFLAAFVDTFGILMIVFGAIFLYYTMEKRGLIDGIKGSLSGIHSDRSFQFYFLAFFMTAFFESVAGFGTPGAIVPLLLISLGFSAIRSIATVLLIDGLFAVSGAIGTPVTAGLEAPLSLDPELVASIYLYASVGMAIAGMGVVLSVQREMKAELKAGQAFPWKIYLALMLPFAGFSYVAQDLTGVLASVCLAVISYLFLFTNRRLALRPWLPYLFLVGLLLLPKLIPAFGVFLSYKISFEGILGTEVNAALQPLRSPFGPFVLAGLLAAAMTQNYSLDLKPVWNKTLGVFLILFPSLAITRLMLASGSGPMPSMVDSMAAIFVETGLAYPLLSPLIGVLGAFITGSTTVSNVIFGPVQLSAAQQLSLPESVVLALQLAGASLGNAVCLFNIIAAAAVANVKDYGEILKKNILPVLGASLVLALLGYWGMYVLGG
ncbi:MAG: L-lactate permease [Bacteroidota bacterium]